MGEIADRLNSLVEARAKEKKIRYGDALREIAHENPRLCEDYCTEVSGRKIRRELVRDFEVLVISHDPQKQLHGMAQARMAEEGSTYIVALTEVCRKYPKLWEAARAQVLRPEL